MADEDKTSEATTDSTETAHTRPLDYLRQLQSESRRDDGRGFHRGLRAWVDDTSEVARALTALDALSKPTGTPS